MHPPAVRQARPPLPRLSRSVALGPYSIVRGLARGAGGVVWSAVHQVTGVPVALKILDNTDLVARLTLRNEVRALARSRHRAIVGIYDHGTVDDESAAASRGALPPGAPWLALEHAAPRSLATREGALRGPELASVLEALLGALAHVHANGLLHRDVKPSNVLLFDAEGATPGGWKLADFGLAHPLGSVPLSRTAGTPDFRAPEQEAGDWRSFGPWTDLYALGRLAVALRWGSPHALDDAALAQVEAPGQDTSFDAPEPEAFLAWVRRLLEPDPSRRWQHAADAAAALRDAFAPPSSGARWRRPEVAADEPPFPLLPGVGGSLVAVRRPRAVGRQAERRRLLAVARSVADEGRPRIVVLEGTHGIGASHLASWLALRLQEAGGARAVRVSGRPGTPPDLHLAEAAASALGAASDATPDVCIARRVPGLAPLEQASLVGLLGPVTGRGGGRLAAPGERVGVFLRMLRELASERPVLLLVEEIAELADGPLLLRRLAEAADLPVLVVVAATRPLRTPEAAPAWSPVEVADEVLSLGPLADRELAALVDSLVAVERPLLHAIVARADGHPGAAVELVAQAVASGIHRPEDVAGLGVSRFASWSTLVDGVRAAHRDEPLAPVALAAVLGETGPRWARAVEAVPLDHPRALEPWLDAGLVIGSGPDAPWRFAHPAVAERLRALAGDEGLLPTLHGASADVLASDPDPRARERRAVHLVAAGRPREALDLLAEAIPARMDAGDDGRATELLTLDRTALRDAGLPESDPRHGWHAIWRCLVLRNRLEHQALRDAADALRAEVDRHGWEALRAYALRFHALALQAEGEREQAVAVVREALTLTEDPALQARLHSDLGRLYELLHSRQESEAALRASLERYRGIGDDVGVAIVLLALGLIADDPSEALAHYEEAMTRFRRAGDRVGMARASLARGLALEELDRLDEAEAAYADAVVHYEAVASPRAAHGRTNLAALMVRRGALASARPMLHACLPLYESAGMVGWLFRTHAWLAAVALGRGEAETYRHHLLEARRRLAPLVHRDLALALEAGATLAEDGWPDLARDAYARAATLYASGGDRARAEAVEQRMAALDPRGR